MRDTIASVLALLFVAALAGIIWPYIPRFKRWHFGLAAVGLFVAFGLVVPPPPIDNSIAGNDAAAPAENRQDIASPVPPPATRWRYSQERDEMRGTTMRVARVVSDNSEAVGPSYGTVAATLFVRQRPEDGLTVGIRLDRGHVLCRAAEDTNVWIRFDDGPIEAFRCSEATDRSTETAFLRDSARALERLRSSRQAIVEVELYQQGRRQFTFQTAGLRGP